MSVSPRLSHPGRLRHAEELAREGGALLVLGTPLVLRGRRRRIDVDPETLETIRRAAPPSGSERYALRLVPVHEILRGEVRVALLGGELLEERDFPGERILHPPRGRGEEQAGDDEGGEKDGELSRH